MVYFLAMFLAFLQAPAASEKSLNSLIDGVDRTFARMRDLSADFVQIFEDPLNRKQQESGHLYLMRPRMMRWEYRNPEEKLFVSDGKTVYLYVPADRQVNKEAVKESLDERIPLMFLVGRSSLRNEFARVELLREKPALAGTEVLRLFPKRKTEFREIVMEVDPANYQIRRLLLSYYDGSRSEFVFSNIRTNTGLQASLFELKVPPGVEVLEGLGQ
jgi:outer membrane lipoprotein carrier protein